MKVCMYICVYVRMNIRIYVFTYIRMYVIYVPVYLKTESLEVTYVLESYKLMLGIRHAEFFENNRLQDAENFFHTTEYLVL